MSRNPRDYSRDGDLVAMVFSDTGNAVDAFRYDSDALRAIADELDGHGWFTIAPNPWTWPASGEEETT